MSATIVVHNRRYFGIDSAGKSESSTLLVREETLGGVGWSLALPVYIIYLGNFSWIEDTRVEEEFDIKGIFFVK